MYEMADDLVRQVEQGRLSRREAVGRLVTLAAAAFATTSWSGAAQQGSAARVKPPTFQSLGLNHVALRVTDIPRSRAFYQRHLGLRPLRESSSNCFLGAGGNNFVALFRAQEPGLDHYCYTIEDYRPGKVVDKLAAVGLEPERHQDRVYFDDPDGLQVQLSGEWNDYPGGRGSS